MNKARTIKTIFWFFSGILLVGAMVGGVSAWDRDGDDERVKIERGFQIAPVHLNLENKNRDLVGLGSYIVNAQAACNDCHSPTGSDGSGRRCTVPGTIPTFARSQKS